jgi:glycerol uptake facilitator-like aquaporin
MPERQNQFGSYAFVLVVVGALVRLLLMAWLRPLSSFNPYLAPSYILAAQDTLLLNFHALGDRVPVYPLLVALCGFNPREIWVAQSIFGVTASLMIFDMAFRRTRHGLCSFLIALSCSLIPEVLIFESLVMTEALTNFLLVASLWLITRYDGAEKSNIRYPLELGSIVALAGLTRPLMICLVPLYYCVLVPCWPPARILQREAIRRTAAFAIPVMVFILGWCGFNYFNSGFFSPTTRAGQQLMDQVDPYVDLAPDRFAVPRDIWLRFRGQPLTHRYGTAEDVYEAALPEMERRTGKTDAQISHEFASLALYLEIHHPLLCLRRAEQGWMQFWGEPDRGEYAWPPGGKVKRTELLTTMADFLVGEFKAAFLVFSLFSIPCAFFRRQAFTKLEYLVIAIALGVSVIAAFTEFGQNRRFCIPLYMLMVYTLLTRGWIWITAIPSRD